MSKPGALKAMFDIRRDELPLALLMFGYFFLVITSFWILKPLKKSLFIQFYDTTGFQLLAWHLNAPQAELLAKVLNMVVAMIAGWAACGIWRMRRVASKPSISGICTSMRMRSNWWRVAASTDWRRSLAVFCWVGYSMPCWVP